jgi:ATP-binding cassette subfamily B (MDR/TAP) protein 1
MGDGTVLESGTHAQLLAQGGVYDKLVEAQKLKEGGTHSNNYGISGSLTSIAATEVESFSKDAELMMKLETPKQQAFFESKGVPLEEPVSSSPTHKQGKSFDSLLRIVQFNRESWKRYILGTFCAIGAGMVYPAYGIIYGMRLELGFLNMQTNHIYRAFLTKLRDTGSSQAPL